MNTRKISTHKLLNMRNSEKCSWKFNQFSALFHSYEWKTTSSANNEYLVEGKNNDLKWFIASKLITQHDIITWAAKNGSAEKGMCAEDGKSSAGERKRVWNTTFAFMKRRECILNITLNSPISSGVKKIPYSKSGCQMWVGAISSQRRTFNFCWIELSSRKMRCWVFVDAEKFSPLDFRISNTNSHSTVGSGWGAFVDVVRTEKQ